MLIVGKQMSIHLVNITSYVHTHKRLSNQQVELTQVAGGGAYYFAKRSVNADRAARHEADMKKRQMLRNLNDEYYAKAQMAKDTDGDVRAEGQPPQPMAKGIEEKYLAKRPYKSTKGDRFS